MRPLSRIALLIAAAALSFSATMTFEATEANAVVCARGVYRAGCAGARGAAGASASDRRSRAHEPIFQITL